jgi:hypothetical protein
VRSIGFAAAFLLLVLQLGGGDLAARPRWTEREAAEWYAKQPWLVGVNYIPSDAINQLEMFQAETFNPTLINEELTLAQKAGMNTLRVFLQDQLWQQDSEGLKNRLNKFLGLASSHGMKTILVLFDSCWDPDPKTGPQHPPIPGVHNSGWVQSPGKHELRDQAFEPILEAYVKAVVGTFAADDRVLGWDIWNEPDNGLGDKESDVPKKVERANWLLPKAFAWAREMNPSQPITSAVWVGNWTDASFESTTTKTQLSESDVISFHNYGWPEEFELRIKELLPQHRPILCTEYMARSEGSTFDGSLPIARDYNVAAISWGLVAGKTQTYLPWDSWDRPYVKVQPSIWFHDLFRPDGTPYRQRELDLILDLTRGGVQTKRSPN